MRRYLQHAHNLNRAVKAQAAADSIRAQRLANWKASVAARPLERERSPRIEARCPTPPHVPTTAMDRAAHANPPPRPHLIAGGATDPKAIRAWFEREADRGGTARRIELAELNAYKIAGHTKRQSLKAALVPHCNALIRERKAGLFCFGI